MTGTNFSSWYRADEGSIYVESIAPISTNTAIASLNSGTDFNTIQLGSGTGFHFFVQVAGTAQANLDGGGTTANVASKVAGAYRVNDFAASLDGGTIVTDTSGLLFVPIQLNIGSGATVGQAKCIKKFAYYPKRLSNAELVSLSTI
jgi:hypothetical protein